MGRERGGPPAGMFTPRELSQFKDLMILTLATLMDSDLDKQIAQALMAGKDLDPSLLQHFMDEASRMKIPEAYSPLMQKVYQKLQGGNE